jgi:hypothetical protein
VRRHRSVIDEALRVFVESLVEDHLP